MHSNCVVPIVIIVLMLAMVMCNQVKPKAMMSTGKKSLYDRLGGVYNISAVVNHFSDALIDNPVVGRNSHNQALAEWHTNSLDRLAGLKFMRTLWVCAVSGGPFTYTPTRAGHNVLGLEAAHKELHISPTEFDAVAQELKKTLDHFAVPQQEQTEVLSAFAAHKGEVTQGYKGRGCPFSGR